MTASISGRSGSACQASTGSAPSAFSAHAASRSSFEPGNTTTAMRGRISPTLLRNLDLVALDQRIGEQALAHPLHLRAGLISARRVHLEVDHPPDARVADGKAELAERALDGFPLR